MKAYMIQDDFNSKNFPETEDDSVMAYLEDDGTGNVTIGGKGGVVANESMIAYFVGFTSMTSIDYQF